MYERTPPIRTLGDVKCISISPSRYNAATSRRSSGAVQKRQKQITAEYACKARKADRVYNSTQREQTGPLEREVRRYGRIDGLVFGAFGEASTDVEQLLQACAKIGAERHWREMGARKPEEAQDVLLAKYRRQIGVEAVRGHATLKLDRLRQVRGGNQDNVAWRRTNARRAR